MPAQTQTPEPATSALTHSVADRLFALVQHMMRTASTDQLGYAAALELTHTQCKCLNLLVESERELSLKEVAEDIGVSLPAASRAVENLLQRGYVERREDDEDRRMKRVRITEAGNEVREAIYGAKYSAVRDFAATLSGEEAERLHSALEPIVARPEIFACRSKESGR